MREAPLDVDPATVLAVVRDHWAPDAAAVEHQPVGFGAWHWRADTAAGPALFVTLDQLRDRHTAESLEATYAGAAALAERGLEFVVAPLPTRDGRFTVPLPAGPLSATRWLAAPRATAPADRGLLDRLHAVTPLAALRRWRPLVGPGLANELADRAATPWTSGPHGEEARAAVRRSLADVGRWTADYHRLAATTDPETWVNTHGEPHERNLLVGPHGPLLVDWETLLVAPRERDLRQAGHPGDRALTRMFDLEWRLDEIAQYATWFESPHPGNESDRVALAGLRHELSRPE